MPAGSHIHGTGHLTDFHCDGAFGECRIKTGVGQIRLDRADTPLLKGGIGDISVVRATGHAEVTVGAGDVRVRVIQSRFAPNLKSTACPTPSSSPAPKARPPS